MPANPMVAVGPDLSFGLSADGKVDMWASNPIGQLRSGAVLMVNTINVSDAAGLRSALLTAATNGQDDVIVLAAGTYATGGTTFAFITNEPNTLTIRGADGATRDQVVLDGGGNSQVLNFSCVGTCASMITLQGLTVQNGNPGVSVAAPTILTLSDVSFSGNTTGATSGGSVTVTNSSFTNNTGVALSGGPVTATNSTFSNNTGGCNIRWPRNGN